LTTAVTVKILKKSTEVLTTQNPGEGTYSLVNDSTKVSLLHYKTTDKAAVMVSLKK
jgi:hypothetical protein